MYIRFPYQFLGGALGKLWKVIISFMCFRMKQFGSLWMDFRDILYLFDSLKSVEKMQVSLTCDSNNGYFTWKHMQSFDNISFISS
jgi:hypothetical protein